MFIVKFKKTKCTFMIQDIFFNSTTALLEAEKGKTWSSFGGMVPIENTKESTNDATASSWSEANGIEIKH